MRKLRFAAASFCRSRFGRPNPLCTERNGTRLYERPLADRSSGLTRKKATEMMKTFRGSLFARLASIVGVAIFAIAPALAQKPGATVHGHVTNPAGMSFTTGEVKFTTDQSVAYKDAKFATVVPIDGEGNYKATGVAPGNYYVYFVQGTTVA